ncbi:MAG: HEPN domain-containing protein [Candidatus Korobacteraceae bacterium]
MATRQQLQQLAKLRLTEAERLYAGGLHDGATYLCGYVLEFALKARICKLLRLKDYPEKGEIGRLFRTHDFDHLKVLAGLSEEITATKNKELFDNWSIATLWKPEQRYFPKGTADKKKAEEVLASVKGNPNGVLTWLSKRW